MEGLVLKINKIAVIGAGIMGSDVTLHLGCYDFEITLIDINEKALEQAKKHMMNELKMIKMLNKSVKNINEDVLFSRIKFQTDYSGIEDVNLVIENVNEDWDIKKEVYSNLSELCSKGTYYAVNTSCIPITKIANLLPEAENVMGVHFMNPVPLKKLVEVIRGYHTSKNTEKVILEFLKSINKNPVVVEDSPGFVANRLSHLFMNEAAFLVQDKISEPRKLILYLSGMDIRWDLCKLLI